VRKVRAVLVEGGKPDARTAALLGASGTLPSPHRSVPWSGKVHTRAEELEQGSWGAEAVNTAVLRTVAAISVGSVIAITSQAVASGSSGGPEEDVRAVAVLPDGRLLSPRSG
jgi:hypothetical protein